MAASLSGPGGRNIGLLNKLRAYALQDGGLNTIDANLALGFEPMSGLSTSRRNATPNGRDGVRLMTNNPEKVAQLSLWIAVRDRVAQCSRAASITRRICAPRRPAPAIIYDFWPAAGDPCFEVGNPVWKRCAMTDLTLKPTTAPAPTRPTADPAPAGWSGDSSASTIFWIDQSPAACAG